MNTEVLYDGDVDCFATVCYATVVKKLYGMCLCVYAYR